MPTSITSSGITFDDATTLTTGVLPTANIANGAVTPVKLSQPFTLATSVASTSGTAIDFTGIPSWVKRITVMFNGVSTNSTSNLLVQIGDAGGVETSGYQSVASDRSDETQSAAGFIVSSGYLAATLIDGVMTMHIMNSSSNMWAQSGVVSGRDVRTFQFAGTKSLSDTLTQIRITTVNGTDTFDAGTINISYEG